MEENTGYLDDTFTFLLAFLSLQELFVRAPEFREFIVVGYVRNQLLRADFGTPRRFVSHLDLVVRTPNRGTNLLQDLEERLGGRDCNRAHRNPIVNADLDFALADRLSWNDRFPNERSRRHGS